MATNSRLLCWFVSFIVIVFSIFSPCSDGVRLLNVDHGRDIPDIPEAEPKLKIISGDGKSFTVDKSIAFESQTIKSIVDHDEWVWQEIHLPNVTGKILAMALNFSMTHAGLGPRAEKDYVKAWDDELLKVDHATLLNLFLASNYLNMSALQNLTGQTIGKSILWKTPAEIREFFDPKNLCPQEEDPVDIYRWSA